MKKYYKCAKCGAIASAEGEMVACCVEDAPYRISSVCGGGYKETFINDETIIITRADTTIVNTLIGMGYKLEEKWVSSSVGVNNGWVVGKEFMAIEGNEIKLLKTINYPKYLFMGDSDSFLFWAKILIEDRK